MNSLQEKNINIIYFSFLSKMKNKNSTKVITLENYIASSPQLFNIIKQSVESVKTLIHLCKSSDIEAYYYLPTITKKIDKLATTVGIDNNIDLVNIQYYQKSLRNISNAIYFIEQRNKYKISETSNHIDKAVIELYGFIKNIEQSMF